MKENFHKSLINESPFGFACHKIVLNEAGESFYGKVAINLGEEVLEQFSEPLRRWFKVHVYAPEKYFFATMFTDITTDKEKEEELRQQAESFQTLLKETPAVIYSYTNISRLKPM